MMDKSPKSKVMTDESIQTHVYYDCLDKIYVHLHVATNLMVEKFVMVIFEGGSIFMTSV